MGKQVDTWLQELHAARFIKLGVGDEDTAASKHGSIEDDFQNWRSQLWLRVEKFRTACQCEGSEQDKVFIYKGHSEMVWIGAAVSADNKLCDCMDCHWIV